MNPSEQHLARDEELRDLIAAAWNGTIDLEQKERLEDILQRDESAQEYYLTCMALHGRLMWQHRGVTEQVRGLATDIHSAENNLSPLPTLSTTHYPLPTTFVGGPVFSYMVATVVLCLMLLGAWAYKISHVHDMDVVDNSRRSTTSGLGDQPELVFVGKITGMNDCRWSVSDPGTIVGAAVPMDRQYALASGLLEITYKSGAKVILEGPCAFKVDSNAGGYLAVGKLTARVETKGSGFGVQGSEVRGQRSEDRGQKSHPSSLIPHSSSSIPLPSPLFAVRTPTALVTDLGTEFGVEVAENGDTVSYVFQGSIKVQGLSASADSGASQEEKVLQENESIRVSRVRETHHASDKSDMVRFTHPTTPPKFVRRIQPPRRNYLDLADIVAGGDGFGRARDRGIDVTNGQVVLQQPTKPRGANKWYGDGNYHAVDDLPLVDGVFIPDGGRGPVQITSAGHRTSEFIDTSNKTWNFVWSGRIVPVYNPSIATYCWLDEVNYDSPNHSVLSLISNKGITFDLDAIRRTCPDKRLVRFVCVAGNAETRSLDISYRRVSADIWIFVDGVKKFSKTNVNSLDGGYRVDISLKPQDRFLTLAATDAGNTPEADWTMFGDPHLMLEAVDEAERVNNNSSNTKSTPESKEKEESRATR